MGIGKPPFFPGSNNQLDVLGKISFIDQITKSENRKMFKIQTSVTDTPISVLSCTYFIVTLNGLEIP